MRKGIHSPLFNSRDESLRGDPAGNRGCGGRWGFVEVKLPGEKHQFCDGFQLQLGHDAGASNATRDRPTVKGTGRNDQKGTPPDVSFRSSARHPCAGLMDNRQNTPDSGSLGSGISTAYRGWRGTRCSVPAVAGSGCDLGGRALSGPAVRRPTSLSRARSLTLLEPRSRQGGMPGTHQT